MSKVKISREEMDRRVEQKGVQCPDGQWRPFKLKKYVDTRSPVVITCPVYGDFRKASIFSFLYSSKPGHPESLQDRKRQTFAEKYGVDNPQKHEDVRAKVIDTCLEKYGAVSALQCPDILEKGKRTRMQKYGVDNLFKSKEFQKRLRVERLQTHGVDNLFKLPAVRQQAKDSIRKKYGVENVSYVPAIREKRRQTTLKNYGVSCSFSSPVVQEKRRQTWIKKYGVDNPTKNKHILAKAMQTQQQMIQSGEWVKSFGAAEQELRQWLEEVTGQLFPSTYDVLKTKQLDMYNEKLQLAIEYCGLHWHHENSPTPRTRNYHNEKRIECEKLGIRLVTIFEDEWLLRQNQVKGFLTSVLGLSFKKVMARKTEFTPVSSREANLFLDQHHIQGSTTTSRYFFALKVEEEIVAVMTFGHHHRGGRKNEVVLTRFAVSQGYDIVGGAGKLFKNSLPLIPKGPIRSWSDNRWSQGHVYQKLGFVLSTELPPDYSYTDGRRRVSKQSQQKSRTGCPKHMTEKEWALERKLCRIWDCGKKVWVYP